MPDLVAPPDLVALIAVARQLLPATVAVAAADPTQATEQLWPDEALPNAIPRRLMEFAAGRSAARQAFSQLGHPAASIPQGPDRAPMWPMGLTGSITHSPTLCLAAVTHAPQLIGIDLEPATALSPDLWDVVLRPAERATLQGRQNAPLLAKLMFCAKEAAYKAQYPRSKTLFGFDAIEITLAENTFAARFTLSVPAFDQGCVLHGRFAEIEDHFLCVVTA